MERYTRFFLFLLPFVILLIFAGCSDSEKGRSELETWMMPSGKIKVLSTTAIVGDLVKQIGKERIDPIVLITGQIDPHSYELVKGDDEKLSYAQMVFYSGLGLEHGASLRYQLEHHPACFAIGNLIQKISPESILKVGGQIDPHIWMDVSLWLEAIDPLVEIFCKMDPDSSSFYKENGDALRQQMLAVHQKMVESMQRIPEAKRFLVTSHDAFNYFARAYLATALEREDDTWQKRFAAPEGLAPEGQLSTTDIQKMIDHLIKYKVNDVFSESNVSRASLKKIVSSCKELGWDVKICPKALYGDAMGPPDSEAGTYLNMMQYNTSILIDTWQKHG
jgi:manganese/zinc/iron transport system substrate-binding protein